ncbi:MAG: hypothetical protein U5J98_07605 [Halobacteriales archaeon]|nr:hypothetical protein [Halobacteriales archaeon]
MTSLAEVYHGARNESLRRLYLGTGLFAAGALLSVVAILVASTGVLRPLGFGVYAAREVAGVLAGLGVPAVFVGIFTVLPASDRERAIAAVGAAVAVLGVVLFWSTYPERWITAAENHLTLPVTAVYFVGVLMTFWSLFTAVVNFKVRNDPGGTVTLERTIGGETQLVEVPVSELEGSTLSELGGMGGVGVVGDVDREPVFAEPDTRDDAVVERSAGSAGRSTPASDGGTQTGTLQAPGEDRSRAHASNPDRYCGSCEHFDYVNDDGDIRPYCGHHDGLMDDMEACEAWSPNAYR